MSNHAHLIISAKENNVSSILGDFKKHTSKQIIKAIKEHPGESRRECLPVFLRVSKFRYPHNQAANFKKFTYFVFLFAHAKALDIILFLIILIVLYSFFPSCILLS